METAGDFVRLAKNQRLLPLSTFDLWVFRGLASKTEFVRFYFANLLKTREKMLKCVLGNSQAQKKPEDFSSYINGLGVVDTIFQN